MLFWLKQNSCQMVLVDLVERTQPSQATPEKPMSIQLTDVGVLNK